MLFHLGKREVSVKRLIGWEEWGGRIGHHFRDVRNMTSQWKAACTSEREHQQLGTLEYWKGRAEAANVTGVKLGKTLKASPTC